MEKLPDSSLVFVVDSFEPGVTGLSPAAALKRIDGLTAHATSRKLNVAVGEAYGAVADSDKPVHLVYVLTDLARTAWNPDKPAEGLDKVAKIKAAKGAKMATLIYRLTPEEIHNVSVDLAEPSHSVAIQGESIEIRSRIQYYTSSEASQAPPATRTVEFYLDDVKKGEKTIPIPPHGQVEVSFPAPAQLTQDVLHRGYVVLSGTPDPLEDDDRRYFSFKIRPPLKVLVIYDRPADAEFVIAAIDPDSSPLTSRSNQVDLVLSSAFSRLDKEKLDGYSCVFLLNVNQLNDFDWGALNGYVRQGGGLVVGMGNRCDPANYNGQTPAQLLPAQVEKRKTINPDISFGKLTDVEHPLFSRYGKDLDSQLSQIPVFRYWTIKPTTQPIEGTRTLMTFADGAPALIERAFKGPRTGRVLLWTTPLSRREYRTDPEAWNELPSSSFWCFTALMNLTVPYMAGTGSEQLNFEAGESVFLKLDPNLRIARFSVTAPDKKITDSLVPSGHEYLEIPNAQLPGQWAVSGMTDDKRNVALGFSLNSPHQESQFALLQKTDLDTIFGKDGYVLAENAQAFVQEETLARYGYEAFPWLMFLILIVVTLENFLANTFYKEAPQPTTARAVA